MKTYAKGKNKIVEKRKGKKISSNNQGNSKKTVRTTKSKRKVIAIICTFLIIIGLCVAAYFLCTSSKFNINQVLVEGNSKYSYEEIVTNANIETGRNIFTFSGNKAKGELKKLPYVEDITLVKKYPGTIVVKVEERKSDFFAYDKDKNVYYRLNSNGVILEQATIDTKSQDEVLTHGITFDDEVAIGTSINESDLSKLAIFQNITQECKRIGIDSKVTKVSFENSLTIITLNDKLNVVFPNDTNLKYNVSFLKSIIANISDAEGVIDLTKSNPTFSTM